MSSRVFSARLAVLPFACALSVAAWAQKSPSVVGVSATRSEVPLTDVVADVTLVDRLAIDRLGAASVSDVLERLPGVTINRNGGPASTTNVYLRGGENRFTAVFVIHSVFESVYLSQRIVVMAARPGRVMADFAVDAPYPRDDLFRTSADYASLCRLASGRLKEAIGS